MRCEISKIMHIPDTNTNLFFVLLDIYQNLGNPTDGRNPENVWNRFK